VDTNLPPVDPFASDFGCGGTFERVRARLEGRLHEAELFVDDAMFTGRKLAGADRRP